MFVGHINTETATAMINLFVQMYRLSMQYMIKLYTVILSGHILQNNRTL